jgi:hypothetical protein
MAKSEEETSSPSSTSAPTSPDDGHLRTRTAIALIVLIFLTSLSALAFVYYSFPKLDK